MTAPPDAEPEIGGGFVGFADPGDDPQCGRVEVAVARDGFGDSRVFEGAEASRRRLFETLRSAGWIHLACHGPEPHVVGGACPLHQRLVGGGRDSVRVGVLVEPRDTFPKPRSTSRCPT